MQAPPIVIHAREQAERLVEPADLDRFALLARAAAEESPGWRAGEEFIFEVAEEPYTVPGIEPSVLIVCHRGADYEVYFYHGPLAETISAHPSWDG